MLIGAAAVLLVGLVASMFVYVPYYGLAPGDATPTLPLIDAPGLPTYDSEGEVLFTTVRTRRLTVFGALIGWLDDDIDVVEQEVILGDRTPVQVRQEALQVMGYSKEVAEYLALSRLGHDVGVTGGGAVITRVEEGVPAGELLARGDTIVAAEGRPVSLVSQLGEALEGKVPGDTARLEVRDREGVVRTVDAPMVARPSDGTAMIGLYLGQDPSVVFDFPVELDIDSGGVGGPSAGLAFTLAVLDHLTPGDLTGGNRVAVTGTIALDGTVGPIGGLEQKVVAVEQADADVFLVPASEVEVARRKAGDDLRVIGVESLDDALRALGELGGNPEALLAEGATPG